jgi:hypothetical protein
MEREPIRERTFAGIEQARARGHVDLTKRQAKESLIAAVMRSPGMTGSVPRLRLVSKSEGHV